MFIHIREGGARVHMKSWIRTQTNVVLVESWIYCTITFYLLKICDEEAQDNNNNKQTGSLSIMIDKSNFKSKWIGLNDTA